MVPIKNVSPNKTLKAGVRAIRTARWITPRTSEHVVLKSLLVSLHCDTHVIFRCGFGPYISVYTFFDLRRSVKNHHSFGNQKFMAATSPVKAVIRAATEVKMPGSV